MEATRRQPNSAYKRTTTEVFGARVVVDDAVDEFRSSRGLPLVGHSIIEDVEKGSISTAEGTHEFCQGSGSGAR
jgi:hypothetical protein